MRRKRRTKYTWFPVQGTVGETAQDDNIGILMPALTLTGIAGSVTAPAIFAIVPDEPKEAGTTTGNEGLNDFMLNEYFLKRLVGKFQWGTKATFPQGAATPEACVLGLGFFIARADDTGLVPIGAAASRSADYGPLNTSTVREPWIWRRTWVFDINTPTPSGGTVAEIFIQGYTDTRQFGSVLDGGHIDAKTARRIKSDERLWGAIQLGNADLLDTTPEFSQVIGAGWLDLRVLGQMRKPRNSGTF